MSESKPVILRSAANPTLRHIVKMRDNRARRKANRVLVDGWRETSQAIHADLELCGVYVPESVANGTAIPSEENARFVIDRAVATNMMITVADSMMDKIGFGQSSRGVVAEFVRPQATLDSLQLPKDPLILVLDQIEKPGNVGAVFRCADAAGVDAILLSDCVDHYNPNSIRSSLGTVFQMPCASGSESELACYLSQHSIRGVTARVESSSSVWATDLTGPLAIILGSEAHGLGARWTEMDDVATAAVRIPMAGKVDSLNISASAAILAFEAVRQRQTG
ncbi:MAG: TrmH family RNA methyltransferase [Rubripirellula sp.]